MKKLKKAYVEITNICNKKCSFCHGTKRKPRIMTKEEFERVIAELEGVTEYLYFHVLGEPLSHPLVYDFISLASSRGFKVTITTNGTLLDEKIIGSGIYKLQISLHSFEGSEGQKEYLDKVLEIARKTAEAGIITSLRLWNVGSVDNTLTERILEEKFPKPWIEGRDKGFTLSKGLYLSYAERFEWQDLNSPVVNGSLFCYGLRDQLAVLSDGTVTPCCLDAEGEIPLGNIYQSELCEILSSKRARAIYDGFSNRQPVEALCKRCTYAQRFTI